MDKQIKPIRKKRTVDLEGQVFGKLTVVEFAGYKKGAASWDCLCECGSRKIILAYCLKSRHTCSCGCLKNNHGKDNHRFVDLTKVDLPNGIKAIKISSKNKKGGHTLWLFRCHCGREFEANGSNILNGNTTSCGCLKYKKGKNSKNFKDLTKIDLPNGITALKFLHMEKHNATWLFKCNCGKEFKCLGVAIVCNNTKSCGCSILGKNNPNYNPNKTDEERIIQRSTLENTKWRKAIFEKDNHTCQCCKQVGGTLNAHHIANWADNPELRYDPDNGVTLCSTCHKAFHKKYGYKNNNKNQLIEFLNKKTNKTNKEIK